MRGGKSVRAEREGRGERERESERGAGDRRLRLITPICFCRGPHMTPGRNFQYPLVAARAARIGVVAANALISKTSNAARAAGG